MNRLVQLFLVFSLSTLCFSCINEPQQNESITTRLFNYPVLKGKANNPFFRISIDNNQDESELRGISVIVKTSHTGSLKKIQIYYSGKDSAFQTGSLFGETASVQEKTKIVGKQKLGSGVNYFWISCEMNETVDLNSKFFFEIDYLHLNGKNFIPFKTEGVKFVRTGVALRQSQDDNVHTYRIPGLSVTNEGTLLAIYDVRRDRRRDLQGDIDIGVSRSVDGGNSWEPMRIALDMGEWGKLPQKFNGVSDANILVDKNTGNIFIAGLWMYGVIDENGVWQENLNEESEAWNHQWRNKGSQPGFDVKETSQFLITKSSDDGISWSVPVNLTRMCKKEEWWLWAPAPGHGITLDDGTLVIPTQGRDKTGLPFSNITYSKDGGKTWKTSNPAYDNTTESMAVQLSDGSIMLNMRNNRNRQEKGENNGRAISVTSDLGKTWTEHPASCNALIEPVCMACIHKHFYTDENGEEKSLLLFSNPNSKYTRHKQTIKVSFDEGLSWPEKYWIELDEGRGAGYSCLTSVDENTIGIVYEGSQAHMTFQTILLSEILDKQ